MIQSIIHTAFSLYTLLLASRIIGSWFPQVAHSRWMHWLARYTDPYLNVFRRLIPPIGGALDLSPLLAFFGLQAGEWLLSYLTKQLSPA